MEKMDIRQKLNTNILWKKIVFPIVELTFGLLVFVPIMVCLSLYLIQNGLDVHYFVTQAFILLILGLQVSLALIIHGIVSLIY